ncbi:phage tail protein [Bowmanella denitrificans]|uniref:phage tail protein n=1 Tax=Bowmanella denitrificans TaxID=366582 RepID=UPI000C9A9A5B|nr:tail fiber protein [Bowmanella denitrificans]
MSQPFVGEIKQVGYTFAPVDWAECNGQLIAINDNAALFSLLGVAYGGDARTVFGIPSLKGRVPIHMGNYAESDFSTTYTRGQIGGLEYVTLSLSQVPAHTHNFNASNEAGNSAVPYSNQSGVGNTMAVANASYYSNSGPNVALVPDMISYTGGGQSHYNIQPSIGTLFVIALEGLYPSRN